VYLYYVYQPLKMISDNEIETILQNVKIWKAGELKDR
jgi:hypothetical protein